MATNLATMQMRVVSVGVFATESGFRVEGMPKWCARFESSKGEQFEIRFEDDEMARRLGSQIYQDVEVVISTERRSVREQTGDER